MEPTLDIKDFQKQLEKLMSHFSPQSQEDAEQLLQRVCNVVAGTIAWEAIEHFNETGHKTCWLPTVDRCEKVIIELVVLKLNKAFEREGVGPISIINMDDFMHELHFGEEGTNLEDLNAELREEILRELEEEDDDADVCSKPH